MAQAMRIRTGLGVGLWRFIQEKPLGAVGGMVLLFMLVVAVAGPLMPGLDPVSTDIPGKLAPPSALHPLGSDELGRDMLSRIIYGARISLFVGVVATILGTVIGAVAGIHSAYTGGRADMILQRVMDSLMAFPSLILALVIVAVLGAGIMNVIWAIAVTFVPKANRVVRSSALAVKETEYIESARASGCTSWRILWRHMLPNCLAPYLIVATALLGTAILVEASLSFLGLGVPPPHPSWGRSLSESMGYLRVAPWLAIFPGIAISLAVFGVNLFGDALRDVWDPRLKRL